MFSSGIGQATGLGATSSVATSAPQNTAEQALSGIAITHGSMDKAFDLKLIEDRKDLVEGCDIL